MPAGETVATSSMGRKSALQAPALMLILPLRVKRCRCAPPARQDAIEHVHPRATSSTICAGCPGPSHNAAGWAGGAAPSSRLPASSPLRLADAHAADGVAVEFQRHQRFRALLAQRRVSAACTMPNTIWPGARGCSRHSAAQRIVRSTAARSSRGVLVCGGQSSNTIAMSEPSPACMAMASGAEEQQRAVQV